MLFVYTSLLALFIVFLVYLIVKDKEEKLINCKGEELKDMNTKELYNLGEELSKNEEIGHCSKRRNTLREGLKTTYKNIVKNHHYLESLYKNSIKLSGGSQWLLDNIYLIEKEYKKVVSNMPNRYYHNLPCNGDGVPRIYILCSTLFNNSYGELTKDGVNSFIEGFISNVSLTLGELWAMPLIMRVVILERIRFVSEEVCKLEKEKIQGENLSRRLTMSINEEEIKDEIERFKSIDERFTYIMAESFLKAIKDSGIENDELYSVVEKKLDIKIGELYKVISKVKTEEIKLERELSGSITSLRFIDSFNWKNFVESISVVDKILGKDPSSTYINMDFKTRDYYRHKIEELSKRSNVNEEKIAHIAIDLATNKQGRESHVGYYLIGEGKDELYKELDLNHNFLEKMSLKGKLNLYRLSIIAMMVLIEMVLIFFLREDGNNLWKFRLLNILLILPIRYIAKTFINGLFLIFIKPHYIPKLSLDKGIDREDATLVVVPTILNSISRTEKLIKDLEVYYLSNREGNIYFALCSDFGDSNEEVLGEDSKIINAGLSLIKDLNNKYGDKFLFLHRKRVFNDRDKVYMGWERKRGKLLELNRLLRGNNDTTYEVGVDSIKKLPKIKYVITLDSDTKVPIGTFKKLIGAMGHPLNYNYGIMQPRVVVGLENAYATEFSKNYVMDKGLNMYSSLSSDIYEDLFNKGIFTGKGIYSVDKFLESLDGKVKDNTMLSHDLIEGELLNTAFLSDTPLVDGFPVYYHSYAMRNHRWIRGDVQNLPWVFRKEIKSLGRYKILDNIKMALVYPSILITILVALIINPFYLELWIGFALFSLLAPIIVNIFNYKNHEIMKKFKQCFLIFTFFINESYIVINAMVKSLYRMTISKNKLLEWQSAFAVENNGNKGVKYYIKFMFPSIIITLIIGYLSYVNSLTLLYFMLPSMSLWILSPLIAYGLSGNLDNDKLYIEKEDERYLRKLSRRIWAYFEDFVNEENNNLGPDNYQSDPIKGVAHRTSPTNIAMTISSNSCAYDLGYIGIYNFTYRLKKTVDTLENLETLNGHFYNWYDTLTLRPLEPKYVSTVDSGNLLSYLWLTEKTIEEYIDNPFINPNYRRGLDDTLDLAIEDLSLSGYFESFKEELKRELTICEYKKLLMDIRSRCKEVEKIEGKTYWVSKLRGNVTTYIKELQIIAPWVDLSGSKDSILSKTLNSILLETSLKDIVIELNEILEENKEELVNNSELRILIKRGIKSLEKLKYDIKDISNKLKAIGDNMDFSMLYNKDRGLFSIGYDVNNKILNNSYYDLMASEARVASYVAITKGDIPEEHWWNLGRSLTPMGRGSGLLSWSGTMFEYLMPLIILKNYEGSLWNETYRGVVEEQVYYGEIKKIPWGISESGYFHFDSSMIYQYKAFGIPKAGLKRGLEDDTVISPYSTMMALMVNYKKAIKNLKVLEKNKALGLYGFYEALDYTKDRVSKGKEFSIIKSFMIHHEGMALMSIVNVLNDNIFRERFHKKEEVISGEFLLQESTYKDITFYKERFKDEKLHNKELPEVIVRNYNTGITEFPESVVLSNGSYHTMINNSGSGFSKVKDMNLYRWSKDYINDNKGMFIYLRDMSSSEYWSATFQPTKRESDKYHVDFTLHKAEFTNLYRGIESKLSVAVSNEENMEVRALTLENSTEEDKVIEITTYLEATLSTQEADISHKAFSNLFIRTESFEDNVLLAYRRPRAKGQKKPYIFQKILFQGEKIGAVEYETSRLNFIGRGNDEDNPRVMSREIPLENSEGTVIDPIFSQRIRMKIPKGEKVKTYVLIGTSESKEEAIDICNRYSSIEGCRGIFNGSYNNSLGELSYLGLKYKQASLYQMMASRILYTNKDIRRRETYIKSLNKHQKDLWSFGVSGDLPIVTLNIKDTSHVDIVRQCVQCHEYLNRRGVEFDLLVINEEEFSYDMPLQGSLSTIINKYSSASINNLRGKIFIQSYDNLKDEGISFIKAISTIYIDGKEEDAFFSLLFKGEDNFTYNLRGLPKEVYNNSIIKEEIVEEMPLKWKREKYMAEIGESIWEGNQVKSSENNEECYDIGRLKFFNGLGGFNEKNHYVIVLKNNNNTPAPWINVISNKKFGFHISESGSSYTWYKNSRENKLTPWNNDFVSDTLGEALFLRDEENGEVFSITPKPLRGKEEYVVEHGFGFSKFSHMSNDIRGEITWFTPLDHSLKIGIVKLKNLQGNKRKISLTYYSNLILGVNEQGVHKTISTYYDEEGNFIYGKNPYSEKFGDTNCYLKIIGGEDISYCGDREDFIGRGRNINSSMAMDIDRLNNKIGGGFDSILSYRTSIDIDSNEEKLLTIVMGAEENIENIRTLLESYSAIDFVSHKLNEVETHWRNLVGTFEVSTPDDSLNILANGWLLYQVISCRYYSRTAFYQSGGAYGYRDQLQDSLSIGLVDSSITRNQIRLNASRQYEEGDVQHWWHPVVDSGIRTRFSDDLLWLPYGVIDYINNTGDYSILEEEEYYLKDEPLAKGEDERYTLTNYSTKKGTIYEHCIKAIDRSLNLGEHGIPLMGCGDWNDGMSTVGNKGTGESVWLGWFLSYILKYFPDICKHMGDVEREEKYLKFREEILNNIEENAWDGAWYRRAYFDDGTPLGSIENEECSIDSLPQSWSIIAEGNNRERQIKAMKSVEDYLVNQLNGMILLLAPPFDSSKLEPGYIKGYVPGVRENGGQYTHAALWVIMAMAEIGNTERALELLNMINPINHTLTFKECEKYKVEPYVITADVYIKEPHGGRGGWSWYTGAASWTYKVILQSILGFQLVKGRGFTVNVNMPSSWNKYSVTYRRNEKEIYNITVTRGEEKGLYMNSQKIDEDVILFSEGIHEVSIIV